MNLRKSTKSKSYKRQSRLTKVGLFMLGFSILGGSIMLFKSSAAIVFVGDPHRATCIQNTPSKTFVKPGSTFTGVVKMQNTGSSTWGPSYGMGLAEYSSAAGNGKVIWNASGTSLTRDYAPGETATFNLTLKAPDTPSTHTFNWGMYITFQGYLHQPCPDVPITIKNAPVSSVVLNNQPSNISVTKGAGLTIGWSASNGATSCVASGNWSGAKSPNGGSENHTGDTSSVGTKSYALKCSNEVGAGATATRTAVVNAPPSTTNPPPGSGTNPPPSSTTPRGRTSNGTPASGGAVDTTPPSAPSNFQAKFSDSVVDLSWDQSTDDFGVSSYELERSTDAIEWQKIGNTITGGSYGDTDVGFQSTYYYRIKALDESGNASPTATTEITTGSFEPNVKAEDGITLTSEDGITQVIIPASALSEQASCDLRQSNTLHPGIEKFVVVSGPYELLCKLESGEKVSVYKEPVMVKVLLNDSQKKQYSQLKFFTLKNDWEEVLDASKDSSFVLGDATDFVIMGKLKTTPLWQKILITLFIAGAIIGGGLVGLTQLYRWRLRRQIEQQNQKAYNNERGY